MSWGGLELNTAKLAHWLRARGWAVEIITLRHAPLARHARQLKIPVAEVAASSWRLLNMASAWGVARHVRRHRARVLFVFDNKDLPLAVTIKKLLLPGLQLVYQQHMQLGRPKRDWLHTRRYQALAAWLTPLPWLARQVREFTRLDPARLHLVPLGIELQQFSAPELSPAAARQQLELPAAAQLLGLIGRFDEGKGQLFVVEAFARLRQELPGQNVQLVLVGESTLNQTRSSAYREAVLARVQALGLAEVVHIREFTQQPEVFYRAIDVFVLASSNETYGMVTIEAMAAGVPLAATAAGGSLDIIDEGRTGLLYPPGDETALVAVLRRLLLDPGYARQLGAAGQAAARARYSHARECELIEAVLAELPG